MVTENEEGEYAKSCDLILRIKVKEEPDRFNMLATASTLAVIAVFDAVSISLMEENAVHKRAFLQNPSRGRGWGKRLAEGE